MSDYTIAVVDDAVAVLELFLDGNERLSLAQLTRKSGLNKSKTFRILATLEKHRLVDRDESGMYRLGIRCLDFGRHVRDQLNLLDASQPVMDWLVQETRETIFLGVIDGREALVVDIRESPQAVRLAFDVGHRAPLYAGGVPKVLLAFLPEREQQAMLEQLQLEPFTPHTITDLGALKKRLDEIRSQGYAITSDDLTEGVHSIAAPIWNDTGNLVAAISVAGPSNRFTEECIGRYANLIQEGAARISRSLGHRGAHS